MEETKSLLQSKTFWGAVIVLVAAGAKLAGYDIDAATQGEITDLIMDLVGVAGASVAIFGRVKATKQIQ